MENHLKTAGESLEFKNKATGILEISQQCGEVFHQIKIRRKHRYILFKVGEDQIDVDVIGERNKTLEDFKNCLPYTDCRYGIFDQEIKTYDGRLTSKLWFICWMPSNSTPYNKMAYASAKTRFREQLPGVFDAQAANLDDINEIMGLTAQDDDDDEEMDL